jgi:chromosome segregation ATPase
MARSASRQGPPSRPASRCSSPRPTRIRERPPQDPALSARNRSVTNFSEISAFQRREEPIRDEDPGLAYLQKLDEAVRRRESARKALEDLSEDQGEPEQEPPEAHADLLEKEAECLAEIKSVHELTRKRSEDVSQLDDLISTLEGHVSATEEEVRTLASQTAEEEALCEKLAKALEEATARKAQIEEQRAVARKQREDLALERSSLDAQVLDLTRQLDNYPSLASRSEQLHTRRTALKEERETQNRRKQEAAMQRNRLRQQAVEKEQRWERDIAAMADREGNVLRQLQSTVRKTVVENWAVWQDVAMSKPATKFRLPGKENST